MKIQGTLIPTLKQSHSVKPFHNNQGNVPKDRVEIRFGNNDDELKRLRGEAKREGDSGSLPRTGEGVYNEVRRKPEQATHEELQRLRVSDSEETRKKAEEEIIRRQQGK